MSLSISKLSARPFLFATALYAVLAGLAGLAWMVLPAPLRAAVDALTNGAGLGVAGGAINRASSVLPPDHVELWAIAAVAMASAGALSLPVAALYTITRQKRGYRQSVVQTLVLLPVIVAGVVVMVKYSLALAFSLAGIVAAVRFRNTLEDSKDAVFVFVATAIGLASGVELTVAVTLSVMFNMVTLLLFRTDFGRTPGDLEGEMAQEHLERARARANRSSRFVASIDHELLENMAPAQLEALAERALQRRREATPGEKDQGDRPRFAGTLRVHTTGTPPARQAVELVLRQLAKEWQFQRTTATDGTEVLEYFVRLRRSASAEQCVDALRRESAAGITDADLA